MLLSIVIPVYQADNILHELINRIKGSVTKLTLDYEVILVEDGSTDNSWPVIENICAVEKQVKGIKLSRNFGQHHAITAGLDVCESDWVVVMDCDLQDKPEEIVHLFNKAQEGYDLVFAKRNNRKDPAFKKFFSRLFFRVFNYMTGISHDSTIINFGIYSKKVIDAIKTMKEPFRAFFPMARWVGFKRTSINVEHGSRFAGKSTYSFYKSFTLAFDIILSYSNKPLVMIVRLGFLIATSAFIAGIFILIKYLKGHIIVIGYTSIIVSIWFLGGLIIAILGILGLYISRIFSGIKNRPLYIVEKKIN